MTKKKGIKLAILTIMLLISMIPTSKVYAAAPKIDKSYRVWLYENPINPNNITESYMEIWMKNWTKNGKITKIKNVNPLVADVTKKYCGPSSFEVKAKAEGTTKVTFRYAGKKYSTKIIVKKWENPCQMFKIGNVDYTSRFDISDAYCWGNRKKDINAKISIKPKKGWKLVKIENYPGKMQKHMIKNNSKMKLSIKESWTEVYAYFKNKKTKEMVRLKFWYSDSKMWEEGNYFYNQFDFK